MRRPTLHVVSNCVNLRDYVRCCCNGRAVRIHEYTNLDAFAAHHESQTPECLLICLDDPGMDAVGDDAVIVRARKQAQAVLAVTSPSAEIVPLLLEAAGSGVSILLKPFSPEVLHATLCRMWEDDTRRTNEVRIREVVEERIRTLTDRELQVLSLVVQGLANKAIAGELHLSQKTVEAHRSKVMHKMRVDSLAELIHFMYVLERDARCRKGRFWRRQRSRCGAWAAILPTWCMPNRSWQNHSPADRSVLCHSSHHSQEWMIAPNRALHAPVPPASAGAAPAVIWLQDKNLRADVALRTDRRTVLVASPRNRANRIDAEVPDVGCIGLEAPRRAVGEDRSARVEELGKLDEPAVATPQKAQLHEGRRSDQGESSQSAAMATYKACHVVHPS